LPVFQSSFLVSLLVNHNSILCKDYHDKISVLPDIVAHPIIFKISRTKAKWTVYLNWMSMGSQNIGSAEHCVGEMVFDEKAWSKIKIHYETRVQHSLGGSPCHGSRLVRLMYFCKDKRHSFLPKNDFIFFVI
jgi:hypothetical protein